MAPGISFDDLARQVKDRENREKEILERLAKTPPEKVRGLLAWKSWSIVYVPYLGGPILASPYFHALWVGSDFTAHRSPLEEVRAGIYSWAKLDDFKKDADVINGDVSVLGKVEVLGDFLYCKEEFNVETKGYRSLRAKIKELAFNLCPNCGPLNYRKWVDLFVASFASEDGHPCLEVMGYCQSCWETDEGLRECCYPKDPQIWTAEEMQKILENRYGCPVLPAPPWVLKGQVVGKVGEKYLVVLDQESNPQS